jgi:5-methyltetrahydrofolate--homocysteine methyltransferase
MEAILQETFNSVLNGNRAGTEENVATALKEISPGRILHEALIPAMDEVGRLFEQGEYFVPEMLVAAQAMRGGLALLKPHLAEKGIEPLGKIALGTVKGDLHDIGKNLVGMMLEGAGFQIIDLGVDVGPEKFIEAVKSGAQLIGMSALLTTTMPQMKVIIDEMKKQNLRDTIKVIIGGAPITQHYADQIGADGFATDASSAVALARSLIKNGK